MSEVTATNSAGVEAVIALIVIVLVLAIAVFVLGYKLKQATGQKRKLDDELRAQAEEGQIRAEVAKEVLNHEQEQQQQRPSAPKWPEDDEDTETFPLKKSD